LWEDRAFFNASVKVNALLTRSNALKMGGFALLLVTATVNAEKTMIMPWRWGKEGMENK
jgi:hypothetical protein